MKTLVVLTALIGLTCAQGGFFSNFFGGGNNRPPPQRRPPPQQQNFRPRPGPQPQQNNFRPPQNQQFRPQPGPSTVTLREPSAPVVSQPQTVSTGSFNCPLSTPNHFYEGKGYIVTFFDKSDGCNKFTGQEADEFCKSKGGRAVSLDSNEKALAMMDLLRQRAQRYMWTGGRIDHNAGVVTWPSGAREGYVRGQRFWSHTGG